MARPIYTRLLASGPINGSTIYTEELTEIGTYVIRDIIVVFDRADDTSASGASLAVYFNFNPIYKSSCPTGMYVSDHFECRAAAPGPTELQIHHIAADAIRPTIYYISGYFLSP